MKDTIQGNISLEHFGILDQLLRSCYLFDKKVKMVSFSMEFVKTKASDMLRTANDRIQNPTSQRRLVLIIVCIALLLDNMLYMVIVPIIPIYLKDMFSNDEEREIEATTTGNFTQDYNSSLMYSSYWNKTYTTTTTKSLLDIPPPPVNYGEGGGAIGILFASKAIMQLMINPLSGTLIDRIGYDRPLMFGLTIMFFSTIVFAFGESYAVLFFARSLQGIGSAFADTSGLAMIADRFREDAERTKALGIAQAFISFGCLVAPPIGGVLYQFAGKVVPFIVLASICLIDGILLLFVMKPLRLERQLSAKEDIPKGTPIHKLLMDPYILVAAGALAMSNVALAFLEPTISMWMMGTMHATQWQIGIVWLPAFLPYLGGVYMTIKIVRSFPRYHWVICCVGLVLEGVSCLFIPFSKAFFVVLFPIMSLCIGVALVDTAILPTLGYLVDVRYVSVYGSVYAIADISYSIAYAFGPIVAGQIVQSIGFTWLNIAIFLSNILYAPLLFKLRNFYEYTPFTNESDILVSDPPLKQYNTYLQNGSITGEKMSEVGVIDGENHLKVTNGKPMHSKNGYQGESEEIDYFEAKPDSFSFYSRH